MTNKRFLIHSQHFAFTTQEVELQSDRAIIRGLNERGWQEVAVITDISISDWWNRFKDALPLLDRNVEIEEC
jgi:hypothetical protein